MCIRDRNDGAIEPRKKELQGIQSFLVSGILVLSCAKAQTLSPGIVLPEKREILFKSSDPILFIGCR